jgi:acetate kinase
MRRTLRRCVQFWTDREFLLRYSEGRIRRRDPISRDPDHATTLDGGRFSEEAAIMHTRGFGLPAVSYAKRPAHPRILAINGGSSSIKFALFEAGDSLQQILKGGIERIGLPEATLRVTGVNHADTFSRVVTAPDHTAAAGVLMDWIEERRGRAAVAAVGHRVVHGGPAYYKPQRLTAAMVEELRRLSPFDPDHLPEEIRLTEACQRRFPDLPQVACFDTAFHHDLPRVARVLPIPRRYEAQGVRRYGFHGLSYAFLMGELARLDDPAATTGRVILAHLGSGASLAAVRDGTSVDTSMSFTPAAGVPMSTRSGISTPDWCSIWRALKK